MIGRSIPCDHLGTNQNVNYITVREIRRLSYDWILKFSQPERFLTEQFDFSLVQWVRGYSSVFRYHFWTCKYSFLKQTKRRTNNTIKMADAEHPIYGPFFGVMGAASAIIFSGKITRKFSFSIMCALFGEISSLLNIDFGPRT